MIDQFLRDIYYPANEGVIQRIKEIRTKYLAKKQERKERVESARREKATLNYIVDNEIAPSYDKINKNKLEETVNAALSKRNFKTINSKIYFDDEVSFLRHWASRNNQMDDYFSARIAVIGYDESSDSMAYMNEIGDAAYFELENKEFNNVLSIIPRLLQPIVAQMNHVSSGCYIDVEAIDDQIEINIAWKYKDFKSKLDKVMNEKLTD